MEGRIENHGNKKEGNQEGSKEERRSTSCFFDLTGGAQASPLFCAAWLTRTFPAPFRGLIDSDPRGALRIVWRSEEKPCVRTAEAFW